MRIKVTGYIDPSTLPDGFFDPDHETGLTDAGYARLMTESLYLEDREFEAEQD